MQVFNQFSSVMSTAKTAGFLVILAFVIFIGAAVGVALFADDTRGRRALDVLRELLTTCRRSKPQRPAQRKRPRRGGRGRR
ncbi:MAG: hypothetical protein HOY79_39225 [Streptomyces sp.]|nr:hypothetical protein [Streptomyces sp.]